MTVIGTPTRTHEISKWTKISGLETNIFFSYLKMTVTWQVRDHPYMISDDF